MPGSDVAAMMIAAVVFAVVVVVFAVFAGWVTVKALGVLGIGPGDAGLTDYLTVGMLYILISMACQARR